MIRVCHIRRVLGELLGIALAYIHGKRRDKFPMRRGISLQKKPPQQWQSHHLNQLALQKISPSNNIYVSFVVEECARKYNLNPTPCLSSGRFERKILCSAGVTSVSAKDWLRWRRELAIRPICSRFYKARDRIKPHELSCACDQSARPVSVFHATSDCGCTKTG